MGDLAVSLVEWAACCRALGDARIVLTARKGGIHERGGRLFAPEHPRFLLMPSFAHQEAARMHPALADEVAASAADLRPGRIRIALWAEVVQVWKAEDLDALLALGPELPWSAAELEARFRYRDQPFLHLLALRVHRLPAPVELPDDPAYAGCRSWLTAKQAVATDGSVPVLGTGDFEARLERIADILGRPRAIIPH